MANNPLLFKIVIIQLLIINYKQIQMNSCQSQTDFSNIYNLIYTPTQNAVTSTIESLLQRSWQIIKRNQYLIQNVPQYCSAKTDFTINEIAHMYINSGAKNIPNQIEELQPKPLLIDSLLPISADMDLDNPYRNLKVNNLNIFAESQVKVKLKDRENSIDKGQKYHRLNMPEPEEQDGFLLQLRRVQDQNSNKLERQRKIKQEKERLNSLKGKNGIQKDAKVSYDYNGEVFATKIENKPNLISKIISGQFNKESKLLKIATEADPISIENGKSGRQQKKDGQIKRKDQVQFSDVKTLAEHISTNQGIKYTHQGKTYQKSKTIIPVNQLKNTMTQKQRLSKDQFARLRGESSYKVENSIKGEKSSRDYPEDQTAKEDMSKQSKSKRSYSQAKLPQSRITSNRQKIHVTNSNLRQKLLQEAQKQKTQPRQNPAPPTAVDRVGTIDHFNMEYIRTGGTLQTSTSRQFFSQKGNNQLPKITHTTFYTKNMPKGRERLKEGNQIIRELRKKFEQKLRV